MRFLWGNVNPAEMSMPKRAYKQKISRITIYKRGRWWFAYTAADGRVEVSLKVTH